MSLWRSVRHGWRVLFQRLKADRELDEEAEHFFEQVVAAHQARGLSREEARRTARLEFGSTLMIREQVRESGWEHIVTHLFDDVRLAARRLTRNPGFAFAAILTFSLGLGATTTIFRVIEGVLLRPLPYPDASRLVALVHTAPGIDLKQLNMSPSLYFTYREESRAFDGVALWNGVRTTVTGLAEPEEAPTLSVTHEFLRILNVTPSLGRGFTAQDDEEKNERTVLLSDSFWKSRFDGSREVLGKRITIDGNPHEVIGVLPASFEFLDEKVSLVVLKRLRREQVHLVSFSQEGIARLKPGVTIKQANADVVRCLSLASKKFGTTQAEIQGFTAAQISPTLLSLQDRFVGYLGRTLWVVMGSVCFLLLIACANVANLLLVRADGRQRELAVRAALGAAWSRIARELLMESLLLGITGGMMGLLFSSAALRFLKTLRFFALPRLPSAGLDVATLCFVLAVSVTVSLLFGLIPAWKYASPRILEVVRSGAGRHVSEGKERGRARGALVILQVALATVLLVSSLLMFRTFQALRKVDPGFRHPEHVQAVRVSMPAAQVKNPEQVLALQEAILHRFEAVPGVVCVSITTSLPLEGGSNNPVFVEGQEYSRASLPPLRRMRSIAPQFFQSLGRSLVAGRDLRWSEVTSAAPVALISESMARQLWKIPQAALGKRIRDDPGDQWSEVIGVTPDLRDDGMSQPAPTIVFWPLLQKFPDGHLQISRNIDYLIRTPRAGSTALIQELRFVLRSIHPDLPLANVRTLEAPYSRSLARTSLTLVLMGVAAVLAFLLGTVGVYAVVAYSVSLKTREIGIRIALGCSAGGVTRLFLQQGLWLSLSGTVGGFCLAVVLTRLLRTLLFGVSPLDPVSFVLVTVCLMPATLLACWIPARRAATIHPADSLRAE